MLKIYNTLAREKQTFTPIVAEKASMYVCGMTVYDYCHLGHARVMVVFDMVSRWLRASGLEVTYVRNITDIDDKIIKRANENNETIAQLTQRFIDAMDEDSAKLGVLRPDIEPRATSFVGGMLNMIAVLIEKGFAYAAANGDVYYSVNNFEGYGKLSGKSLEDLRAGERVEVDTFKKDPMDFVLWKAAKPDEPSWESPWGKGRPGWHIECSAMSAHYFGAHFDIHGGGQDLQFPHHENEIAQSEAFNGAAVHSKASHSHDGKPCQMVNYWMHNGFVRVDDEKMSKSLGNFFTIRTVLEKYDAEVVRFFILRAHYRSPLNYSDQHLDDAKVALTRLYTALRGHDVGEPTIDWQHPQAARFKDAMNDDFNTPEALAVLFDLANEVNKTKLAETARLLKSLASVLGLLQRNSDDFLQGEVTETLDVDGLIQARLTAKQSKNFAEADAIRKQLAEAGIVLEDTPQGTTWRRA
ncbi:MAG: cysteine--tRNA ligase [Methylotenera sp.]|nr:cysteine--tRNA ligase [Methylotenera sp.]MDP1755432.1 cysteine--tRNA ligase [Methylotenera sp.]MDP1960474.1 cysteine--tRNA ligase [Methylotenera sp.]MDP3207240.1 cysteine--tRNA ligase [Methylotenera sp.]MDP3304324.1 cysteine--tRNA ligase [Methylotenera sp.]